MQRSTAEKLRLEWQGIVCEHLMVDREYDGGTETGNYACLICGKIFDIKRLQLLILLPFLSTADPFAQLIKIIQAVIKSS